jgi:hypothetical protein
MANQFRTAQNRKHRDLTVFAAVDASQNDALLRDICSNATTGYVRQDRGAGFPTSVPSHAAEKVADHLVRFGWERA